MDRRKFIQASTITGAALTAGISVSCAKQNKGYQQGKSSWPICLNTSTIRPASLELFNREHWKQNPLDVSKTGLKKIMKLIQKAELL